MLDDVQRESGATFLVSTHNMSAARRLADHVAVIHDGRIVAGRPGRRGARLRASRWSASSSPAPPRGRSQLRDV